MAIYVADHAPTVERLVDAIYAIVEVLLNRDNEPSDSLWDALDTALIAADNVRAELERGVGVD
jgi:hypothetical protein